MMTSWNGNICGVTGPLCGELKNGRHSAGDIFRCIFVNEKLWILIKISLKFVPKASIDNNPAFVKTLAWRRIGDKPLSDINPDRDSLTHICGTRGKWGLMFRMEVNESHFTGHSFVCSISLPMLKTKKIWKICVDCPNKTVFYESYVHAMKLCTPSKK